jgi:Txe/YoeB family toxin of Txe-Axe toxin-antitoxin module
VPAAPATTAAAPAMADDGDLIEKEWVLKVKQVVRATAHDPYEQNLQFTKLKADYMQKRYGKSIKLD